MIDVQDEVNEQGEVDGIKAEGDWLSVGHLSERGADLLERRPVLRILIPTVADHVQHLFAEIRRLGQLRPEWDAFSVTHSIHHVCYEPHKHIWDPGV